MRCVNAQGFSLHAEVCCAADERKKLEHLCHYITRPAIANERLALNRAGQVVLTLKTPYRDGTTHIVMSPLEFLQPLAALVPRPPSHPLPWRARTRSQAQGGACLARRGRSTRLCPEIIPSSGRQAGDLPVPGFPSVPLNAHTPSADPAEAFPPATCLPELGPAAQAVFEIDLEHCPHCGGPLKIIAAIEHPSVIAKILTHLGLPARAPPDRSRGHRLIPNGLIPARDPLPSGSTP